jgi:hypothetical protein
MRHPVLDGVLGDHARVVGGAAGDDEDLVDVAQVLVGEADLVEDDVAALGEPAEQGVRDRLRLLGDLLEHEVVVAALLGGGGVPVDVELLALGGRAVEVGDLDAGRGDQTTWSWPSSTASRVCSMNADTSLARKFSPVAPADHQRRVAPGGDHRVGHLGVHGEQREGALEPADRAAHRLGEQLRPLDRAGLAQRADLGGEQVGRALGVGVAGELDAGRLQLAAEAGEVLDDAVVDDGDPAVGGQMRVRVAIGRAAVRGPPGVPDRRAAGGNAVVGPLGERLLQVGQLAGLLLGQDGAVVDDGHPRGVVPAVLEPAKAVENDAERGRLPT